ncbi:MAG: FMN-binding protein [Firmicutes bacterium HGW-Firmicutes-7]|nr:MAG: FMN-binding protein [Firmicutes bacterium HGW-Firmicutes-7]
MLMIEKTDNTKWRGVMKRNRIIITVLALILLGGVAYGMNYAINYSYYQKVMGTVIIEPVDISSISDGLYTGSFDAKITAATVGITVKDGEITDIDLIKHKHDEGAQAVTIIDDVLGEQSLEVDVVSGATNSSNTILKAIEVALKSDPK